MKYDQSSGLIPTVAFGTDTSGAHPGMMYDPHAGWTKADGRAVAPQAPVPAPQPQAPPQQPIPQPQPQQQAPPHGAPQGMPQGAPPQTQQQPPQGAQADPYAAIASNPVASTQLATYAQARQMLDPQWQQAAEQQRAQLVAQGLNPNDAAYQNSQQLFGNQQNQAYNSALFGAINAGDQEQNTLYGQNLASGQFANSAQNQNYNQQMGQAGLYNAAQGQAFGQNLAAGQFGNAAQGQVNSQNAAQAQFGNAAQLQGNQESAQQAQFYDTAQGQANAQNAAAAGFQNTAQSQGFNQGLANAQLSNQAAQQQFQNQAYAQNLPINEFNSLMSSSQVGMPPSGPVQNTQVATPNTLGAYQLNSDAQQATYQSQMQNYQSGMGGLFNLGSAAIGAGAKLAMSDVRLKRDITLLGRRSDGIGVYRFRYRGHPAWRVGVMAQEVQHVRPDAVFDHGGILGVDYGRLAA